MMPLIRCIIICCLTIGYAFAADDINGTITNMINTELPDATVGVTVQDVVTGKIVYDYQGTKLFLPASTAKLFTAAAALKQLGPDYCFETALYYDHDYLVSDGVYGRDLALKFTGDPSFKIVNLYSLLGKLSELKIKKITGDIILDDSLFDGPLLGFGWTLDSTAWYYSAPVSAIIIDRNQFGITLYPVPEIGAEVHAKIDNIYPGSKNRTLTTNIRGVTYEESEAFCQLEVDIDDDNNVELAGCWPVGTEPVHLRLAVKDPALQAEGLIRETFDKLGIEFSGNFKYSKVPNNLHKLAHHKSESLSVLLNAILGDSNNLYAESLTKTLGAELYGIGSFKTGSLAVRQILSSITGIDFSQTRLLDGSGASRYNLLTPQHLSRLLYTMHHEPSLGTHFREALSISGVNGTLKTRFASFDTKASIKAKTGSLNGVSALSGYLTTRSGRELIVTIMINHALDKGSILKQFENELCYFLVNEL